MGHRPHKLDSELVLSPGRGQNPETSGWSRAKRLPFFLLSWYSLLPISGEPRPKVQVCQAAKCCRPLVAQTERICPQCGRPRFNPWVDFCLGNPMDRDYSPWGGKESDMTEPLTLGRERDQALCLFGPPRGSLLLSLGRIQPSPLPLR